MNGLLRDSHLRFTGPLLALACSFPLVAALAESNDDPLPPATRQKIDFNADIKPILAKHCISCHGAAKQESGFRVDTHDHTLAGGDRGKAFEIGESAASLLIRYVGGLDPDITMPPEGDLLSKTQIGKLRAWIDQGATWPKGVRIGGPAKSHWAYAALKRPAPPNLTPKLANRVRTPIDAFVFVRLAKHGLAPAPTADRYTLARRLSLDLLGLPPTPDDVDRFVQDTSPNAYHALVDRLLDSKHFGERWGRHWLDKARYADSDGYEKDRPRLNAWRWRDWVIDAVNRDMPFDQFTIEQIAGDLLPDANEDQLLATAFHRQTLTNTEGGTDKEQWRVEAVFDRAETTGAVWLGLTVGCARCHSHKYDQITQREYYQFFAFYNNGDETNTNVAVSKTALTKFQSDKLDHDKKLATLERALAKARDNLGPAFKTWTEQQLQALADSHSDPIHDATLTHLAATASGNIQLDIQDNNVVLASGPNPDTAVYTLIARLEAGTLSGLRLEIQPHPSLPGNGPGRAENGNLVVTGLKVEVAADANFSKPTQLKPATASASFTQAKFFVEDALDGKPKTGWAISPQMGKPHAASFFFSKPVPSGKRIHLRITLTQDYGGKHTLGRFRIVPLTGTQPGLGLPKPVLAALISWAKTHTDTKSSDVLRDHYTTIDKTTAPLVRQLAGLEKKAPKRPQMSVRVVRQRTDKPRTTFLFHRGDFLRPQTDDPAIPAGFSTLPPVRSRAQDTNQLADRLDLARWLVADANPLSPRVAVNHIWSHLFGNGLVRTINDFGVRGDKPSHPDLLDWLATEYRRLKWSRKALIRTIVLSATYRQSSATSSQLAQSDPQNALLGRQTRFRLQAEIIRDNSLTAAGLLSHKLGGPSVFPPMPADVAALSYANNFKWKASQGADRFRRGMYTFFKRTAPHPNLVTFDCPDSNTTCVQRRASNTPLQALTTLNNEVFVEASQALARRVLGETHADDQSRLARAFRLCVARHPGPKELAGFDGLLKVARKWYSSHADDAKSLVGNYPTKGTAAAESAAWVATCRIMLNMDEFITRE
jgi:mono/diheme cytochrome c family protein